MKPKSKIRLFMLLVTFFLCFFSEELYKRVKELEHQNRLLVSLVNNLSNNSGYPCIWEGLHFVSAYTSRKRETDNTPFITASGYVLKEDDKGKVCASNYYPFGTLLYIESIGWVRVVDRLNKRYGEDRIDIYFGFPTPENVKEAKKFGVKTLNIYSMKGEGALVKRR